MGRNRTPRVVVVALGGTIAMTGSPTGGAVPALTAVQLLDAVPGLDGVDVDTVDLRHVPGASVRLEDVAAAREVIGSRLAAGADGVVVTQGTDTIEETSYLLDLTYGDGAPVVITGAMRNPSLAGADGPANLLAAIRTAADPRAGDQGVLVAFADEIHAARRVRKTHSSSTGAFRSPDGGPLGYVVEGRPVLLSRLTHRTVVPVPGGATNPRVGLVTVTLGDDGAALEGAAQRYDGLVVAGFGVGHVPEPMVVPLAELAGRIPVVLASRTGAGPVLAGMYAFPGSEYDLLERGLLRAGFLDPLKARLLLWTLLRATTDREVVAAAFAVAGGYADPASWPWSAGQDSAR